VAATVLVAGIDGTSLLEDSPILQRDTHTVAEAASARALLPLLAEGETRLVLLGAGLHDLTLQETLRRIRASPATRKVSLLVVLPETASADAAALLLKCGANAVLQQPLDRLRFDSWVTRLLVVPRRVELRVPIEGQVVGSPRDAEQGFFAGLTRNVSSNGLLLASPVALQVGAELDLEISLSKEQPRFRAVGRVVRRATEVAWPYLGFGIEYVFVPPDSQTALQQFLAAHAEQRPAAPSPAIASTIRRGEWIYEVLVPTPAREGWQVEIRRGQREGWRAGAAGPYYVLGAKTPEAALAAARAFIERHG